MTDAAKDLDNEQIKKSNIKLPDARMRPLEQVRTVWGIDIPADHELSTVMKPAYWGNIARKLRPGDHLYCDWEDLSQSAYLKVIACGDVYAIVSLERHVEHSSTAEEPYDPDAGMRSKFDVSFKGNTNKYCVLRKEDNVVLKSGFQTKKMAENWLDEHIKALNR